MADDVTFPIAGGTVVAAEDIGSKLYQRVKLVHGADGVNDGDISFTNPMPTRDHLLAVEMGLVPGQSIVHKFGKDPLVATTFAPVSIGRVFQTPQVAGATTLRVKAGGDVADTAAGAGAREITLEGLDETGALVSESVATAGASASSATTITFMRLFRAWVSASGTYATSAAGSHVDDIVIENGAGGTDWGTVQDTSFARSRTLIGQYSVPLGKTAYVVGASLDIDSAKATTILMFKRENILETAAPYTAMELLGEYVGATGHVDILMKSATRLPALTDFGFMAKVATGNGEASVHFEMLLKDD